MALFKGAGVAFAVLFASASHAFAAGGPAWDFIFSGSSFSQMNQPAPGIGISLVIKAPGSAGTFTTPTGQSQGTVDVADRGSAASEGFSDFGQFQAFNATPAGGTWTLNAVTTAGSAQYHFSADFSQVSIPQAVITSPIQGATTDAQPTLLWTATGPGATVVQVSNADFSVDISQLLVPGQTSFTPPTPLPPGDYSFFVEMSLPQTDIPITLTRVAGPDLNINPIGSFTFLSEAFTDFTVVPEPVGLGVAGLLSMALARRRSK